MLSLPPVTTRSFGSASSLLFVSFFGSSCGSRSLSDDEVATIICAADTGTVGCGEKTCS